MKMPFSSTPALGTEAQLRFGAADYEIIRKGAFVRCAVTGAAIPLDDLKYWSAELQEAYAGPEAVVQRITGAKG